MQNRKELIGTLALLIALAFLGLPIPDWLANVVGSISGTIGAMISIFSNLIEFVQLFARL